MSAVFYHIFLLFIPSDAKPVKHFQEEKIYTVSEVSVKPQPVKGLNDFHSRWEKKVVYPEVAVKANVQGIVFVEFVVNHDGAIINPAIRSGISEECDEAALKGFKEVSKESWKPAVKNGQPVKVKMVLPFAFRIINR